MRWAIINLETNTVENVIIWDGNGQIFPFDANQLIHLQDDERCEIGAIFDPNSSPRFIEQQQV
jgi:hypothetical protein